MDDPTSHRPQRRNKGFEETHTLLIDVAVRLISDKGVEALSLAGLARAAGVNRTTVYYHFPDRDAVIAAVRGWSAEQLAKAFAPVASQLERANYITRFVLENPEVIRLWIEDFVSGADIRQSYPEWDRLVAGVQRQLDERHPDAAIDAEIYCVNMLTVAMIGPRIYHNSVRPGESIEAAVEAFNREQLRMLAHDGFS